MNQQDVDFTSIDTVFYQGVELQRIMLGGVLIWEHAAAGPKSGNVIYDYMIDYVNNFGAGTLPAPDFHIPVGGTFKVEWTGTPPTQDPQIIVTTTDGRPYGTWSGSNPGQTDLANGATWTPPPGTPAGTKFNFYSNANYVWLGSITVG